MRTSIVLRACYFKHVVPLLNIKELQPIQAERLSQRSAANITELPINKQGSWYVLVVMGYFTMYLFPLTRVLLLW